MAGNRSRGLANRVQLPKASQGGLSLRCDRRRSQQLKGLLDITKAEGSNHSLLTRLGGLGLHVDLGRASAGAVHHSLP
jgi:hypothetical protein